MSRRKLIKKLALVSSIIFVISIIILISQIPYRNLKYGEHKKEFNDYMDKFTKENQNYLQEIAKTITVLPVDPHISNELKAKYMIEHQQPDRQKKYLWISTPQKEFHLGIPERIFAKLNNEYDKKIDIIKKDDYYRDRDDYLSKLVGEHENIDFSQFERSELKYSYKNWRFYKPERFNRTLTTFSTPLYDTNEKLLGTLYMRIDDSVNYEKYLSRYRLENDDLFSVLNIIFGILCGLSGAFLWFLLPTWVYTDAQERDVKNPGVWAFLTLTSLFFGLTIYLITRPANLKSFHCPHCEGELNGTKAYCPHCGNDLSSTFCQECQYPIKPLWKFCPNCRSGLKTDNSHSELVKE